jgi:heme/copper-type cytochrome/quinol oxidase subunit 2
MRRVRELFTLTVSEQRVIIVLLVAFVLFFAVRTYRDAAKDTPRGFDSAEDQPSPSPGMRP